MTDTFHGGMFPFSSKWNTFFLGVIINDIIHFYGQLLSVNVNRKWYKIVVGIPTIDSITEILILTLIKVMIGVKNKRNCCFLIDRKASKIQTSCFSTTNGFLFSFIQPFFHFCRLLPFQHFKCNGNDCFMDNQEWQKTDKSKQQ